MTTMNIMQWERRIQVAFDDEYSPPGGGYGGGLCQKWKQNVVLSVVAETQLEPEWVQLSTAQKVIQYCVRRRSNITPRNEKKGRK